MLQRGINHLWYGRARPLWLLRPLSKLYGALFDLRRWMYRKHVRRRVRIDRPVIVVGNVTVGGTGKTPLVAWLVERLTQLDLKPGILTRGYGASESKPRLVQVDDDPHMAGDEPVLLARRTKVPVAAGRDRIGAAQLLIAAGCDVIVSDDGLQHMRMERDCEIAVVDGARLFGNGALLPAGPLREPRERLDTVNLIVVNGPYSYTPRGYPMQLRGDVAFALLGNSPLPLSRFNGQEVHAVAGIGNPKRFFDMLRERGIRPIEHALPDHAEIRRRDIYFEGSFPVLMTEKDAVKCVRYAQDVHFFVPVTAYFDEEAAQSIMSIVLRAIGKQDLIKGGQDGQTAA